MAADNAAFGEQILNIREAEVKAPGQPNAVSDQFGWEAMVTLGRRGDGGAIGHGSVYPPLTLTTLWPQLVLDQVRLQSRKGRHLQCG